MRIASVRVIASMVARTPRPSRTYPLWRMIAHLLNHQSYHRGQVTNYLRLLGVEPPRLDLLVAYDMGLSARQRR